MYHEIFETRQRGISFLRNHILKKIKNVGILLLYTKMGRKKSRCAYTVILIMLCKHLQVRGTSDRNNINIFRLKNRKKTRVCQMQKCSIRVIKISETKPRHHEGRITNYNFTLEQFTIVSIAILFL